MGINGFKDVKIYRKEGFFTGAFRDKVYTMARLAGRQRLYSNAPLLILETAGFFMLFVTVVAMLYLMKASTTSVFATLALLAVTAWRILPALNRIMGGVTHSRTTIPFILKILEYLENTPQEDRRIRAGSLGTAVFQGSFSLVGVDFLYGGQFKALDNCTCTFLKGKSIGIIGHSGAGKSTLVDIIIGLLKPQAGSILLDGREMTDEDWHRWRSIIGYVPQTPYIYDGTIAENVAFGVPPAEVDRDLLRDVCRMASMDFIDEMPSGMDTVIGERGIRLSGGQRQRLSIARSLYYKPEVLIFDEATSSLDHKSEKIIQNTIYSLKGKQTLIIIAHRLSTVEDCDYLIWLEKGKLVEIGPPEAIIEKYDDKRLILKR
jgi:ABC-type multidrug transport system fused ATPase/permease subunit